MTDNFLSRRELLELTLRAAALPGGAVFFSSWLSAGQSHSHQLASAPAEPPTLRNYMPQFFSPEDFEALRAFTEILIPTDEDPGAREAYCAHFIDFLLNASNEVSENQQHWRKALELVKTAGFHQADSGARQKIVEDMARPEIDAAASHPAFSAYRLIKSQTAFAFYTSRAGMIETLHYKGNTYNAEFPACTHPEHHTV